MAVIVIVLTLLSVKLFHLQSGHPTPAYLVVNVVYSLAAALVAGIVAGKIADRSAVAHGIALAILMLIFGAISFSHHPLGQPLWYQVFLLLAPPLAAIAGSALVRR